MLPNGDDVADQSKIQRSTRAMMEQ